MTKYASLIAALALAACTSADYGSATPTTEISARETGGFAPIADLNGVRLIGVTASFMQGGRLATQAVSTQDVTQIIGALEDIKFLDLDATYDNCPQPATDATTVRLAATLTAGANQVDYYSGCSGGMYDKLEALRTTILDKTGYTAWVALDE